MERENSAALRDKLEAAERERDELRGKVKKFESYRSIKSKLFTAVLDRAKNAEAELARRDAAASEPVGFVHESQLARIKPECGVTAWIRTSPGDGDIPIYTAAQPAVLLSPLDNWHISASGVMASLQFKGDEMSFTAGANWMREQCLALGAQQQKVVELNNVFSINVAGVPVRVVLLKDVSTSLDAAGVKWEVKK